MLARWLVQRLLPRALRILVGSGRGARCELWGSEGLLLALGLWAGPCPAG